MSSEWCREFAYIEETWGWASSQSNLPWFVDNILSPQIASLEAMLEHPQVRMDTGKKELLLNILSPVWEPKEAWQLFIRSIFQRIFEGMDEEARVVLDIQTLEDWWHGCLIQKVWLSWWKAAILLWYMIQIFPNDTFSFQWIEKSGYTALNEDEIQFLA